MDASKPKGVTPCPPHDPVTSGSFTMCKRCLLIIGAVGARPKKAKDDLQAAESVKRSNDSED